jgi:hypothetical protein
MWRTPEGNRTLSGVEAEVFLEGLRSLATELRDQRDDHESDVPAFDALSFGQRVSTLQDVANGLLRSDVPIGVHTAANEAAIYAIFRQLHRLVVDELMVSDEGEEECLDVRGLLCRAGSALRMDGTPPVHCTDDTDWERLIETLCDRVLWDRDFEIGSLFLDSSQDTARSRLDGESEALVPYFIAIPHDPSDVRVERMLADLLKS